MSYVLPGAWGPQAYYLYDVLTSYSLLFCAGAQIKSFNLGPEGPRSFYLQDNYYYLGPLPQVIINS